MSQICPVAHMIRPTYLDWRSKTKKMSDSNQQLNSFHNRHLGIQVDGTVGVEEWALRLT